MMHDMIAPIEDTQAYSSKFIPRLEKLSSPNSKPFPSIVHVPE